MDTDLNLGSATVKINVLKSRLARIENGLHAVEKHLRQSKQSLELSYAEIASTEAEIRYVEDEIPYLRDIFKAAGLELPVECGNRADDDH